MEDRNSLISCNALYSYLVQIFERENILISNSIRDAMTNLKLYIVCSNRFRVTKSENSATVWKRWIYAFQVYSVLFVFGIVHVGIVLMHTRHTGTHMHVQAHKLFIYFITLLFGSDNNFIVVRYSFSNIEMPNTKTGLQRLFFLSFSRFFSPSLSLPLFRFLLCNITCIHICV